MAPKTASAPASSSTNSDVKYEALESQDSGSVGNKKDISRAKTGEIESASQRAKDFAASLADSKADTPLKQAVSIFLKYVAKPLIIVFWIYAKILQFLYKIYKLLPLNLLQIVFGAALCFFGGVYFTSIAAIEAFRNFGGQIVIDELTICWEEGCIVAAASAEDDKVDDNKDGIADVQQISTNELINRKARVAMIAVKDPQRLMKAVQYLMSAYVSVLATLKFQFAKTVALSLAIAEMLELPAVRIFGPVLAMAMGPDLNKWVSAIITTAMKIIAIIIATYIQMIISAFYSALRGGSLVGEAIINLAAEYGIMDKLPDRLVPQKPFDPNNSWWDEIIGFPLAAAGFYYQFTHGFSLPFPWDLLLLPLTIVEWILRWQVFT